MIFSDTKYQWCYFKKISKYIIFALIIGFKLFQTHCNICVCVYPLKWHETEYFSVKLVKNWDYVLGKLHETEYFSVKLVENQDYVLWKRYETEYSLVKPVKKSRLCPIISELCLFVNIKWLRFKKILIYVCFLLNFQKKDLEIEFKMAFFRFTSFVLSWLYQDLISYLIGSWTRPCLFCT